MFDLNICSKQYLFKIFVLEHAYHYRFIISIINSSKSINKQCSSILSIN